MAKFKIKDTREILALLEEMPPPKIGDIAKAKVAAITCKSAQEFADFLGIDILVFKHWCNSSIQYKRAVGTWRDHATNEIEVSMARRAIGFTKKVRKDVIDKQGNVHTLTTESYFPPDPAAAQFWLKNRAPEDWKDKSEVDVNVQANIRAWLIAAENPGPELIEGSATVIVGISNQDEALILTANSDSSTGLNSDGVEPLNITHMEPISAPEFVVQEEDETELETNQEPNNETPLSFEELNKRWLG